MNLFIMLAFRDPERFLGLTLIVVFSICCHEFCHAWAALRQGDDTAAVNGHLTLNPLRQMGWMSLIMFLFVGLAWGAVPVDPAKLKHRFSRVIVSVAGPAANLILFILFTAALALTVSLGKGETSGAEWLMRGGVTNIVLFLLNMMPVPGFDGWGVLAGFFPRLEKSDSEFIRGSFFVVLMLVFFGIKYFYVAGYLAVGILGNFFCQLGKIAGV